MPYVLASMPHTLSCWLLNGFCVGCLAPRMKLATYQMMHQRRVANSDKLLQVVECERRIERLSEEDQAEKRTCDGLTAESKELMAANGSISAALEGSGKRLAEQRHTLARWAAQVSPSLNLVGLRSPPSHADRTESKAVRRSQCAVHV